MELFLGEYKPVQQDYGLHLRLSGESAQVAPTTPSTKAGSYGVSIRVQGIDGHPYLVLNNAERGRPLSESAQSRPQPLPHRGGPRPADRVDEACSASHPPALPGAKWSPKVARPSEDPPGTPEGGEGPPEPPQQGEAEGRIPAEGPGESLGPTSPQAQSPMESEKLGQRVRGGPPKPPSPPLLPGSPAPSGDPKGPGVRDGGSEEPGSPDGSRDAGTPRPDLLPFRRQDSDGSRSRRSSASSAATAPPATPSSPRLLAGERDGALHANNVNRHENRRYIPFLPGTGRDVDTGSLSGVDQLIEKFDQGGAPRRGRSGKRGRVRPGDWKRSRSVDSADGPFPFSLRGDPAYLDEFNRNLGKSTEHLLRPSQVCQQQKPHDRRSARRPPSGQAPDAPEGTSRTPKPGKQKQQHRPENKAVPDRKAGKLAALPAQARKGDDEVRLATATLQLQNHVSAAAPESTTKKISLRTFPAAPGTQATPDLLKGQKEVAQQGHEETAKQILFNYLREGIDNDDVTKRKVNLVFEKIQTLRSRAAASAQGSSQAAESSLELKTLLEQKSKLSKEVTELQKKLDLEMQNQQNLREERDQTRGSLEELQRQHEGKVEENAELQKQIGQGQTELRKTLEELFRVRMEREQHQLEIRDLQDQLSEMHDELDSAKHSEDGEKAALIEELLQMKHELQEILISREEQEDLLRRRERELTALKGVLKDEVSSHDQEMDRLKEQYDAELQALRDSVDEATQNIVALASRESPMARNGPEGQVRALAEENEKLRARVRELELDAAQLENEVDAVCGGDGEVWERVRKLEGEKQQLQEALARAEEQDREMVSATRALEKQLEDVQRSLSQTTQEQQQLMAKLKEETKEKEQLRRAMREMEKEHWQTDKTIEKLRKEVAEVTEASRASTLELQNQLSEAREKTRKELGEMQRQLLEKTQEADKSRKATQKLQDETLLLEEELRAHRRAQDEALTKRQLLEQTLKGLEYELEAKSHLKEDQGRQVKLMEDKVSQLEMELDEERNSSDLLSERVAWSREQIEQMRSELVQERASRQNLECDKISLERQNKDLKSRILHLEESHRSGKEGLVTQMEARLSELEEQLDAEKRDRVTLQVNNRRLERRVKELVMQVDDDHLSLTDQKDQLSLRLKAMKRQMEEAEEEIDRLESAKKKLQRELEEQVDVNEQLQGQLNAVRKDLRWKRSSSRVLDDLDDDDFSTDGESVYEGTVAHTFSKNGSPPS
ncbi:cingulin-like protein 1 [Ornithorhynchus anatinus]|uniref:Cingulin like 1 n=1 Tax=Ornithorhynchus anatinus TaxID=9258 RepID=A0A6I8NVT9_ORNAN|nr:cingulin-like protein 1 [Ornithorhynchus anatinus]XP_028926050.1 cingulin-like protein 1 [Ornithorhynchus anatinus]XP_039768885.1 cingulin-like protein 1 [Ornithorhynchus anatinus]